MMRHPEVPPEENVNNTAEVLLPEFKLIRDSGTRSQMRLLETPILKIPGAVGSTHRLMQMRSWLMLCSVVAVAIMSADVYGQQEKSRTKSRPKTSVAASSVDSRIASIIDADTRNDKKQQPAIRAVSRATADSRIATACSRLPFNVDSIALAVRQRAVAGLSQ